MWRVQTVYGTGDTHLEFSTSPQTGPWQRLPSIHKGNTQTGPFYGFLIGVDMQSGVKWLEYAPGSWALFAHDKIWFGPGGWNVGHLGTSW